MKRVICIILLICLAGATSTFAQETKSIQLPTPQTDIGKPLMQTLKLRQSARTFDTKALPQQELSNLLWAAFGINRPESGKRTAPSAMNWQEIDVYVALPEALYLYEAKTNSLKPVLSKDLREVTGKQPFVKDAPLNVGFIAQNVYLYCASQGLAAVMRGMVDRPVLAKAMNLRPEQRVMFAQTVGYPK
ncbi:MAG: SagB/ThcOx family dehydrogenase [Ignavibacteriales bacterium]|nr:SagB/ThcOx family dehydrogenase [Ignavibacteriales bacterium]